MHRERRVSPRISFSSPVRVCSREGEAPCVAANLSASGILLFPQRVSRLPSDPLTVQFALPSQREPIAVQGRLARYTPTARGPAWGVEFARPQPEVTSWVNACVVTTPDLPPLPAQAPPPRHTMACPSAAGRSERPEVPDLPPPPAAGARELWDEEDTRRVCVEEVLQRIASQAGPPTDDEVRRDEITRDEITRRVMTGSRSTPGRASPGSRRRVPHDAKGGRGPPRGPRRPGSA